ncbi:MAG: formyltransferase family protein [Thermoleophilaceae bacterium]
MRVILLGKHKRSAVGALEHLVQSGCDVVAVVAPPDPGDAIDSQRLDVAARRHHIELATDDDLYARIGRDELDDIDLVLSFLFWKRLRRPLIELGRIGCLNFHPAPLPDIRGLGGFNVAILEGFQEWGVSAHFVDEEFDTGDLVEVERFPIAPGATALSLDIDSQARLLGVFRRVIDAALAAGELPRTAQGDGRYVTREQFEAMRRVQPGEDAATLERRIRAFWYPPYDGATMEVAGRTVTLVDRHLLDEVAAVNRRSGRVP